MALICKKKKGYFWHTFHIFKLPGKSYKNSFSTYLTHIQTFFALPILKTKQKQKQKQNKTKKKRIYQVWFLFGMIPGVDSYSRHFGTINK